MNLKSSFAFFAITLLSLSIIGVIVDGVAILLAYVSLIPALIAYGEKTKKLIKVYGLLFLTAHIVLGVRISLDIMTQTTNPPHGPVNFSLFEECSNLMFSSVGEEQSELTDAQKVLFDQCMNLNIEVDIEEIKAR